MRPLRARRLLFVVPVVPVAVAAFGAGCVEENVDGVPDNVVDLRTNVGGDPIELDNVTFSDDPTLKEKGGFPAGAVVESGAFVVVEVDDAGVGFKLGKDEELHLYAVENGVEIDSVDWADGDCPAGGSYARVTDGQGEFATVTPDSRGRTNN